MRKSLLYACPFLVALTLLATAPAAAQNHKAVFTWLLSPDDTTANCTTGANCIQNLYRAAASCTVASTFAGIATGIAPTVTTYTDTTITPGVWCYGLTFAMNGNESVKATVTVSLQPSPPTQFTASSVT